MLNRLCLEEQIPLVNIVRKPEQEEILRPAGTSFVCNSTSRGFIDEHRQGYLNPFHGSGAGGRVAPGPERQLDKPHFDFGW
jgi:hypothetical protein